MSGTEELKIGKKAEIYITKKIREKTAKTLEEAYQDYQKNLTIQATPKRKGIEIKQI